MRANLARIGNSQGVPVPKQLLEASSIVDEVELSVEEGRLIVTPVPHPRAGWEEAFAAHPVPDDEVIGEGLSNRFDEEEWTWRVRRGEISCCLRTPPSGAPQGVLIGLPPTTQAKSRS